MTHALTVRTPTQDENTRAILVSLMEAALIRYDMKLTGFVAADIGANGPDGPRAKLTAETKKEWARQAFGHVIDALGVDSPYCPALAFMLENFIKTVDDEGSGSPPRVPFTLVP